MSDTDEVFFFFFASPASMCTTYCTASRPNSPQYCQLPRECAFFCQVAFYVRYLFVCYLGSGPRQQMLPGTPRV